VRSLPLPDWSYKTEKVQIVPAQKASWAGVFAKPSAAIPISMVAPPSPVFMAELLFLTW
jgi:hypothetical protein